MSATLANSSEKQLLTCKSVLTGRKLCRMATKRSYGEACRFAYALDVVGERWALLVVRELLLGPKRFTDLRAGLPHASSNILSERLRELEQGGVVQRRKLPPPAASTVYELTEWGRELEPVVTKLGAWGARSPIPPDSQEIGADSIVLALRSLFDPEAAGEIGRDLRAADRRGPLPGRHRRRRARPRPRRRPRARARRSPSPTPPPSPPSSPASSPRRGPRLRRRPDRGRQASRQALPPPLPDAGAVRVRGCRAGAADRLEPRAPDTTASTAPAPAVGAGGDGAQLGDGALA